MKCLLGISLLNIATHLRMIIVLYFLTSALIVSFLGVMIAHYVISDSFKLWKITSSTHTEYKWISNI